MSIMTIFAAFTAGFVLEYLFVRLINNRGYIISERTGLVLYFAAGLNCGFVWCRYFSIYPSVIYGITLTVLLTAAAADICHMEIPAFLNLVVFGLGVINLVVHYSSAWPYLAGFLLSGLIFLGLALTGGVGGGDVKLVASLGLLFGYIGIIRIIAMTAVAGALTGCLLILAGRVQMKDAVPLAPFIYAAVVFAVIKL